MLDTKELYDQELKEARATLSKVQWYSPSIVDQVLRCTNCQSELVEQTDPENEQQHQVHLHCKTCGASVDLADAIEHVLDELYGAEAYTRRKDAGEDGPLYACPACDRTTLVEGEDGCANCSEPLDYTDECIRCGAGISIQDYLDGLDGGLCSYCDHVTDKVMRED